MEIRQIMEEVQTYMHEIVSLYENPPTPPISLTALVKAWEVVNFLTLDSQDFSSPERIYYDQIIDKRLQAR